MEEITCEPWMVPIIEKLGALISKPKISPKYLAKPPFRFLMDVVRAVMARTHFLEDVVSDEELARDKDKPERIEILLKIHAKVTSVLQRPIPIKPQHILAGMEAEKTGELLLGLWEAATLHMQGGAKKTEKIEEKKAEERRTAERHVEERRPDERPGDERRKAERQGEEKRTADRQQEDKRVADRVGEDRRGKVEGNQKNAVKNILSDESEKVIKNYRKSHEHSEREVQEEKKTPNKIGQDLPKKKFPMRTVESEESEESEKVEFLMGGEEEISVGEEEAEGLLSPPRRQNLEMSEQSEPSEEEEETYHPSHSNIYSKNYLFEETGDREGESGRKDEREKGEDRGVFVRELRTQVEKNKKQIDSLLAAGTTEEAVRSSNIKISRTYQKNQPSAAAYDNKTLLKRIGAMKELFDGLVPSMLSRTSVRSEYQHWKKNAETAYSEYQHILEASKSTTEASKTQLQQIMDEIMMQKEKNNTIKNKIHQNEQTISRLLDSIVGNLN